MKYILAITFGIFLGLSVAAIQGYTDVIKSEITRNFS
jgi:hypothetical protein